MVDRWTDKFDRDDNLEGLGSAYETPCGAAALFDETAYPVAAESIATGATPPQLQPGLTANKTQVLYVEDEIDTADQQLRAVFSHVTELEGFLPLSELLSLTVNDPSFTLLARMSKDPVLVDLGSHEDPHCFDQGYGLRFTCPRAGGSPILKLIKYQPVAIPLGQSRPASLEPDGALVLASVVLQAANLNLDPDWDGTGDLPYRGNMQEMRLRIRRSESQVVLEAYLNSRNLNSPILSWTDYRHPLWGVIGRPGFEFLSAALTDQPAGASPYSLRGMPLMGCHLFEVEALHEFARPHRTIPKNKYTYERIANRVIELVEKNGDAKYTQTVSGQTKINTYLEFVYETEKDIARVEGYWSWLKRTHRLYLENCVKQYDLPADCAELQMVRPGNWTGQPLPQMMEREFRRLSGTQVGSAGFPRCFTSVGESVNEVPRIEFFPTPTFTPNNGVPVNGVVLEDPFVEVDYYAAPIIPDNPAEQVPYVPQRDIDVLIYGATYKALLLDTDPTNAQFFEKEYGRLLLGLRRANNRLIGKQVIARSAADIGDNRMGRVPLTRIDQIGGSIL